MNKKAFTLIEIMITIAIIGIMISVASVGLLKARQTAQRGACQENQTKIDGAVLNYILDYNIDRLSETPFTTQPITDASAEILFGVNSYVKVIPRCPANGTYTFLAEEGSYGESVVCSLSTVEPFNHTYPE
ncbi:MAG: prepilin-type N-terminal cleavage/methylation domain-containing protein [Sumerlaeia bacterium]